MRLRPSRFTAFRGGHILTTAAAYYRLTRDRAFLRAETPALAGIVARIAARQRHTGPAKGRLVPEPLSTDLESHDVDSVPGQVEAVEGLLAIGRVWSSHGDPAQAARARTLAVSIDHALRPAVARASVRLHDGSLFVPDQLTTRQPPFKRLTDSRDGSYWNLVMPYAFASGWFPAHSTPRAGSSAICWVTARESSACREPTRGRCTEIRREPGSRRSTVSAPHGSSRTTTSPISSSSACTGCLRPA